MLLVFYAVPGVLHFACTIGCWAWRFNDVIDATATELVETTMYVLSIYHANHNNFIHLNFNNVLAKKIDNKLNG